MTLMQCCPAALLLVLYPALPCCDMGVNALFVMSACTSGEAIASPQARVECLHLDPSSENPLTAHLTLATLFHIACGCGRVT